MAEKLLVMFLILLLVVGKLKTKVLNDVEGRTLSRKKRFLTFPEGSSLQLVYCLTIPSIGMGNIFTIGWTAALAWELPNEPIHPYRKKENNLKRLDNPDTKLTSGGWKLQQKGASSTSENIKLPLQNFSTSLPYATIKDYLINPGYSKIRYNANPRTSYREHFNGGYVDYRPIYDALQFNPSFKSNQLGKEATPFYSHPVYKEAHRRTRRDLFSKIEKFLDAQRADGKACLLKAICDVSKASSKYVGTFMEEIIKAIFRIRPYTDDYNQDEYDLAADEAHNCTEKYSRCSYSVWSLL